MQVRYLSTSIARMTNVAGPQAKKVEIHEKIVTKLLCEERAPSLGADLDANGKNLKRVGIIECEDIKCPNIEDQITSLEQEMNKQLKMKADKDHNHSDIVRKVEKVEGVVESIKSTIGAFNYAEKEHAHKLSEVKGDMEIKRVVGLREEIDSLVGRIKSQESHEHIEEKNAILNMKKEIEEMKVAIDRLASDDREIVRSSIETVDTLESKIIDMQIEIRKPKEKEPVEIICSKNTIVPLKADARKIALVSAYDINGNKVDVKILRGNEELIVGSIVFVDDFLTLTPNTLVRILFA